MYKNPRYVREASTVRLAQPKPDANALKHMAKRLAGLLKEVGVSVAAGVMEAYINAHMGLP
jgi:hypothetical protein